MFKKDEKVVIVLYPSLPEGVVEKVSTWGEVLGFSDPEPCYFVRVPSWDRGTNGGRWMDKFSLQHIGIDPQP